MPRNLLCIKAGHAYFIKEAEKCHLHSHRLLCSIPRPWGWHLARWGMAPLQKRTEQVSHCLCELTVLHPKFFSICHRPDAGLFTGGAVHRSTRKIGFDTSKSSQKALFFQLWVLQENISYSLDFQVLEFSDITTEPTKINPKGYIYTVRS